MGKRSLSSKRGPFAEERRQVYAERIRLTRKLQEIRKDQVHGYRHGALNLDNHVQDRRQADARLLRRMSVPGLDQQPSQISLHGSIPRVFAENPATKRKRKLQAAARKAQR